MALDGEDGSATRELAERAGRKQSSMTMTRSSLIAKGVVYPPALGRVAFTVPGMATTSTGSPTRGGLHARGRGFVRDDRSRSYRLMEPGAYPTISPGHDEPVALEAPGGLFAGGVSANPRPGYLYEIFPAGERREGVAMGDRRIQAVIATGGLRSVRSVS
jgi:hypothetical protein